MPTIWQDSDLTPRELSFARQALRLRALAQEEDSSHFALLAFDDLVPTVRVAEYLIERGAERIPWQNAPRDFHRRRHVFAVREPRDISAAAKGAGTISMTAPSDFREVDIAPGEPGWHGDEDRQREIGLTLLTCGEKRGGYVCTRPSGHEGEHRAYGLRNLKAIWACVLFVLAGCSRPVVNINTADVQQLRCAPGISAPLARAIVAHRREYGPYRSVEELQEVPEVRPLFPRMAPALRTYGESKCTWGS